MEDEYRPMMENNNPWELIYDEEMNDKYGKYLGLVDNECIDLIEKEEIP